MTVTRASLVETFKLLTDDEVAAECRSGELTTLAQEVAAEELRRRGLEPPESRIAAPPEDTPRQSDAAPAETEAPEEAEAPAEAGEGDLVPVARFLTPMEAQVLRSRLDADGVSAFVVDANLVQANPFLSGVIGGVRVLVPQSDLARAQEIVAAIRRGDYALPDEPDTATR